MSEQQQWRERAGRELAAARRRSGLSQTAIAERCGVSLRTVQRWEAGRASPDVRELVAFARACGVPPATLLRALDIAVPPLDDVENV